MMFHVHCAEILAHMQIKSPMSCPGEVTFTVVPLKGTTMQGNIALFVRKWLKVSCNH
jgi:hypothetical protein